jgi:hypothetical protein
MPHWSRTELFYQSGTQIIAVSYTAKGDQFEPGKARVWASNLPLPRALYWDLAPDGKRLVVVTPMETPEPPKEEPVHTVVILQNFFDELRRRAPVGK